VAAYSICSPCSSKNSHNLATIFTRLAFDVEGQLALLEPRRNQFGLLSGGQSRIETSDSVRSRTRVWSGVVRAPNSLVRFSTPGLL
jgi:hypothetical protein